MVQYFDQAEILHTVPPCRTVLFNCTGTGTGSPENRLLMDTMLSGLRRGKKIQALASAEELLAN